MIKAVMRGKLWERVDCYIVEDENGNHREMIGVGGIIAGIGAREKGSLKPYLERLPSRYSELAMRAAVDVSLPEGGVARCYPAVFFGEIIDAYTDLFISGELHPAQAHMGLACAQLTRALAKTGLVALIHEATGYQLQRSATALQDAFRQFIADDPCNWDEMWSHKTIKAIANLHGYTYAGGRPPRWMSSTMEMIYKILLPEEVIDRIQKLNPDPHHGSNHHQWLTPEIRKLLKPKIEQIGLLARQSASVAEWKRRYTTEFQPIKLLNTGPAIDSRQTSFWGKLTTLFSPRTSS